MTDLPGGAADSPQPRAPKAFAQAPDAPEGCSPASPAASVLDAAHRAGWSVAALDLEGAVTKDALMDRCVRALTLPDWFGRNWDALYDVLTDVSLWPGEPGAGRLLAVTGWAEFADALPEEWETAREVFADAVDAATRMSGPPLNVALLLGTG